MINPNASSTILCPAEAVINMAQNCLNAILAARERDLRREVDFFKKSLQPGRFRRFFGAKLITLTDEEYKKAFLGCEASLSYHCRYANQEKVAKQLIQMAKLSQTGDSRVRLTAADLEAITV